MNPTATIIFPHQLFYPNAILEEVDSIHLIEENLFFQQFKFSKQKIAFHRASMKSFQQELYSNNFDSNYVESNSPENDIRQYVAVLAKSGVKKIVCIDPTDFWLEKRLRESCKKAELELVLRDSPMFLNTPEDLSSFFKPSKKKFYQTTFYKQQRILRNMLLEQDRESPKGGKWTFDAENRKKYPKNKIPPAIQHPDKNAVWDEALAYTNKYFSDNPGQLDSNPIYPFDRKSSQKWFQEFLEIRFSDFGAYEDAIVKEEIFLNHSVLSPMLNNGLIDIHFVINQTLEFGNKNDIPINSLEGFVRQLTGWREFIRGIYSIKSVEMRTGNFWNFSRPIPPSFYKGETGIEPIDDTIKKVLKTGYCHHIERLMILGNFMVLCEFDPKEVYRWFMELFVDAYDWVMVPNVYEMSQFASGGIFASKPYISGSNYILKMSNYKKGPWQETWDALFWSFMTEHRDFFLKNPRLSMLVRTYDKFDDTKKLNFERQKYHFLNNL